MFKPKMDPRIWQTGDGHLHTSIPTDIPEKWERRIDNDGTILYVSGEYVIERIDMRAWPPEYGGGVIEFRLTRQTVPLSFPFSRLRDAKAYAQKNARGEDRVNVA